jgi:hypothetical protein
MNISPSRTLILALALAASGCASTKAAVDTASHDDHCKRMMEHHRAKMGDMKSDGKPPAGGHAMMASCMPSGSAAPVDHSKHQ